MSKPKVKPNYRRRLLRLPDLDHCKRAVLNSLDSLASRRVYEYAIDRNRRHCQRRLISSPFVVVAKIRDKSVASARFDSRG